MGKKIIALVAFVLVCGLGVLVLPSHETRVYASGKNVSTQMDFVGAGWENRIVFKNYSVWLASDGFSVMSGKTEKTGVKITNLNESIAAYRSGMVYLYPSGDTNTICNGKNIYYFNPGKGNKYVLYKVDMKGKKATKIKSITSKQMPEMIGVGSGKVYYIRSKILYSCDVQTGKVSKVMKKKVSTNGQSTRCSGRYACIYPVSKRMAKEGEILYYFLDLKTGALIAYTKGENSENPGYHYASKGDINWYPYMVIEDGYVYTIKPTSSNTKVIVGRAKLGQPVIEDYVTVFVKKNGLAPNLYLGKLVKVVYYTPKGVRIRTYGYGGEAVIH